ncbi:MAG: RagB/SusD family nutrient uptake outer membrane protein [Bacteroidales bacterium]|nr:RagB/SusD family nutrient uptake outer membrane protein [Bacteroidales bacterium]
MKKKFSNLSAFILCASALSICSCSEDILEVKRSDNLIPVEEVFSSEETATNALNAIYAMVNPDDKGWGRTMLLSCCATLDAQSTGADVCWNDLSYTTDNKDIAEAWAHAYKAIRMANIFISGIADADESPISDEVKKTLASEAKALRGFFYHFLLTNFGEVPFLEVGDNSISTAGKQKASFEELCDHIIQDFTEASPNLDWIPYNGDYGRCTKGMSKTYLADTYMWKAAMCPDKANDCYSLAKSLLEEVLRSGTYELMPSFNTLWDYEAVWNKETIWASVIDSRDWTVHTASPRAGGDGMISLSWEWFCNMENYMDGEFAGSFDKRRNSCCLCMLGGYDRWFLSGSVKGGYDEWLHYNNKLAAIHPYTSEDLSRDSTFHSASSHNTYATTAWSTKYWRTGRVGESNRTIIYFKRLADVILDYAECCFKTGNDAEGFERINQIRNRAFGNLEVGNDLSAFCGHLTILRNTCKFPGWAPDGWKQRVQDGYPGDFNTSAVAFPTTVDYYNRLKANMGFRSDLSVLATNMERVKEFSCEPFRSRVLVRSGFLEDYVNTIYPKSSLPLDETYLNVWRTARHWEFNPEKVFWPIPSAEIELNELMTE